MTGRTLVQSVSLALFFTLSFVFFPLGSPAASPAHPPAEGVFRFPLFYVPAGLDPVRDGSISTTHVAQQIFDGLVAFDRKLRIIPGLAESWTVSKNGREYLFSLRKGVRFHDGSSFEARDVAASLTRIFRPGNSLQFTRFLDNIVGADEFRSGKQDHVAGIRVISDYRIAITLKKPYAPFLAALAMPLTKIVPSELAGDAGDADDSLSRHPVGTGPFRFVSWEENTITLKANDGYFLGTPSLREVRFIFYPGGDRNRAFADFLKGNLEGCPLTAAADPSKLRKQGY
ncbi:MAG: ABC transporter substrate-binding protein, partial [Deltaproteobacteria bacterium]|nr:ABC transporter substrate-binding protein [Deltaproteobacteria bacterium]